MRLAPEAAELEKFSWLRQESTHCGPRQCCPILFDPLPFLPFQRSNDVCNENDGKVRTEMTRDDTTWARAERSGRRARESLQPRPRWPGKRRRRTKWPSFCPEKRFRLPQKSWPAWKLAPIWHPRPWPRWSCRTCVGTDTRNNCRRFEATDALCIPRFWSGSSLGGTRGPGNTRTRRECHYGPCKYSKYVKSRFVKLRLYCNFVSVDSKSRVSLNNNSPVGIHQ